MDPRPTTVHARGDDEASGGAGPVRGPVGRCISPVSCARELLIVLFASVPANMEAYNQRMSAATRRTPPPS